MNLSGRDAQDWEPVVFKKRVPSNSTDKNAVRAAQRSGSGVETVAKIKGEAREYSDRARKLEADVTTPATEAAPPPPPLPTLSAEMRKTMITSRTGKKMTQQQLAQAVNTQPKVIQELEGGKVVQDKSVLQRINKVLGCSLRFT